MTFAPEAHKTAGVLIDRDRLAFIIASNLDCTAEVASITGIGEAADEILAEIEDALLFSTPSVPAVAELSGDGLLEWRCFHCDDVFKSEREARLHFGREDGAVPACQIKGSEGGLVEALRRAEDDAAEAWAAVRSETVDAVTAYHAQAARHREQIRVLEQVGYDRGLADAKAHPEALGLILSTPSVPAVAELSGDVLPQPIASGAAAGWMPKVKALDWEEIEPGWWSIYQEDLRLGFEVRTTSRGTIRMRRNSEDFRDFDGDVDAAKAACQADFERRILAALDIPASGDDPKALDATARSSSTEAVEQEVGRLRKATETAAIDLECIATSIRHGYEAQAAVDAEMSASRLRAALAPVPAACKPEGETHG